MVECQFTMVESKLQLSLVSLDFSLNLHPSNLLFFLQYKDLYKRGSTIFPHKIHKWCQITIQNTYLMDILQWWKSAPDHMHIPSPISLLMATLYPACARAQFGSSSLSSINAWITPYIHEAKMRGPCLYFLECAPHVLISWHVMRWSDAPASL